MAGRQAGRQAGMELVKEKVKEIVHGMYQDTDAMDKSALSSTKLDAYCRQPTCVRAGLSHHLLGTSLQQGKVDEGESGTGES